MVTANLEWFQKAIHNISLDQNVVTCLSDVKIALSALNANQLKYTSSSLNLSIVFDCLNSSAENQIELACEVLKTFLSALEPSVFLSQYGIAMVRALKHPNVKVKLLVLFELNRAVCESDLAPQLSDEQDLLLSVIECVCHEDISVARQSIQFLVRLGTFAYGLTALYSPKSLDTLNKVMKTSDTNRFRVYEIAVDVSANSVVGLEASNSSGILKNLLGELKEDDVLVLLTTLEFVTKLALTYHGFKFLENHTVISHLAAEMSLIENNPLASLVLPGLIKFFGNVAQLRPQETFQDYPKVIETIFKATHNNDPSLACVALETIGYIATTSPGKLALHKQGTLMKEIMARIWEVSTKWQSESRVRALNTLANIVRLELSEQDTEMLSVVKGWFDWLGPSQEVMGTVMDSVQQPFPEIKLAALLLLQVLAEQPWGQHILHETPGLPELLLDRGSDTNMEEKSARFAVINTLAESPTSDTVFGEEIVKRFKSYMQEGIAYVQLQTEVAIEKAN